MPSPNPLPPPHRASTLRRRVPVRAAAVLLALAAVVAGCGGTGGDQGAGAGTTTADADAAAEASALRAEDGPADDAAATAGAADAPEAEVAAPPPPEPVTIVFGGDVHFEGRVRASLDREQTTPLGAMAGALADADLTIVNLETAITDSTGAVAKQFTFRAPPAALDGLLADGVDAVSLANNHGMDFGLQGLHDTLAAGAAAGLPILGAGLDADQAFTPWVTTVGGQRVAVLAATQVLDSAFEASWTAGPAQPGLASAKQPQRLVDAVVRAGEAADTVVVVLHWGVERQTCPTGAQQELARALVDAGADVVVGGHAHRLQGAGRLDGALVGYGLGNLVFSVAEGGEGAASGLLRVTVQAGEVLDYQWVPATIVGGLPRPLEGDAAAAASAAWERLRDCTGLAP